MEGPTPVSALIHAATMVTAGVFLIARSSPLFEHSSNMLNLITILGGFYGAFEVYKDYMDMKAAISEYVTPDLSGINERLSVIEKEMQGTKSSVMEATDYTNEIKNDLKRDIRRIEGIVENAERTAKESARETMQDVKDVRNDIKKLEKDVDEKIKQALDNPLAK